MREDNPAAVMTQSQGSGCGLSVSSLFIGVIIMGNPCLSAGYFPDIERLLGQLVNRNSGPSSLIALCGAGGKTSTLFWLARHFAQTGLRVLITTTTRMYLPTPDQYDTLIIGEHVGDGMGARPSDVAAIAPGITALFAAREGEKVSGPSPAALDRLKAQGHFDLILVEADGARGRLFKLPALHEPCIPSASDWVIALTGAPCIEAPAGPEHIHRWEQVQAVTGLKEGQPLTLALLDGLLDHPEGIFKGAPTQARRVWLINGNYQNERAWERELASLLGRHPELHAIWLGAVREPVAIRYSVSHVADSTP